MKDCRALFSQWKKRIECREDDMRAGTVMPPQFHQDVVCPLLGGLECKRDKIRHDLLPQQQRQHHGEGHADEGGRPDVHAAPPSGLPTPEAGDAHSENHHSHAEVQERVRHPAPPAGRRGLPRPQPLRVAW